MAAHQGAVSERTVLLALLFALMLLIVMGAYLMGRLVGGQNMSALTAVGNLVVTVGVIPKESLEARGPAGSVAGTAEQPQTGRTRQTTSAAALAGPTEDPVVEATAKKSINLDPSEADDRAAGESALAAASQAGDLAASDPLMSPTFVSPPAAHEAAASDTAAIAATTGAAARDDALPAAAPGAPVAGASAAGGAAKHAAAPPSPISHLTVPPPHAAAMPPPPISHLTVPPPPAAAALPPPAIYSVELGFFLSDKAAEDFAAELQKRGLQVSLVNETDAAGRSWTYVRSGRFTDSVQALGYAIGLSLTDNLSGQVVTEKAVPAK